MASIKDVLNQANPNTIDSGWQCLPAGDAMGLLPRSMVGAVGATVADVMDLPTDAKAMLPLYAFVTAGAAPGIKLRAAILSAPAAGEFGVTPGGDLIFAAGEATAAEAFYLPMEGVVFTDSLSVVGSVASMPSGRSGMVLLSATVGTGLVPGAKTIVARGAAPAAGEAALDILGQMVFNAADVINGTATVQYIAAPGVGQGSQAGIGTRLDADLMTFARQPAVTV